jgi:hypothetical protein
MTGGKSISKKTVSKTRAVRSQLGEVVTHLRQIVSSVVVTVAALKQQNCEVDEDIAIVLQRSVADRIQDQIERLEATLRLTANLEPKSK